ncbi:MAG: hypothetical protein V1853_00495 [bacterium]
MAQISHDIEKFLLFDPEKNSSTVNISITYPTPVEERTLGRLFIITEIDSNSPMNQELIGIIQGEMQRAYYQTSQVGIDSSFEQALQHVNDQLKRLIENGVTDWTDKFNIIIGVIKDYSLIMTQIGSINALLLHGSRIVDIISSSGPEERKLNPVKIFSNIITGEIKKGDYLIFYTPSLLDYLSQEKLKRIIIEHSPLETVRQLEILLHEASDHTAFGALIVHCVTVAEPSISSNTYTSKAINDQTRHTQSSMEVLIAREKKTDRLLAPSLWQISRKFFQTSGRAINSIIKSIGSSQKNDANRPLSRLSQSEEQTVSITKKSRKGLSSVVNFSAQGGKRVSSSVKQVFDKRQSYWNIIIKIPSIIFNFFVGLISAFPRWSFARKAIFISIILLLFFFAQSIVTLGRKEDNQQSEANRQQIISDIQDKTFQAEAALSYEDDIRAGNLLSEADALLNTLKAENTKDSEDQINQLTQDIEQLKEKTRNIIRLIEPAILTDLASLEDFNEADNAVFQSNNIFVPDAKTGNIYQIIPEDGSVTMINNELIDVGLPLFAVAQGSQSVLVYHDLDGVYEYLATSDRIQPLSYTPANIDKNIIDIATYQSRFYQLDIKNNQISRYQQGASGFGQGTAWINQSDVDISSAVSMAIDGSIYLLDSNGQIRNFSQGVEREYSLQAIDPQLNSAQHVWTDATSPNLYLLDRDSQRLIVFTKAGRLKVQFTSDSFDDLKDMAIDENNGRAYLLNGSKIYSLDLNASS